MAGRISPARPQHDQASQRLREALLTGRIAPGAAVTVASLAELLGTGTMPMREALRRIIAEGGLEPGPTRRLRVPELSAPRFAALLQARSLLEPEAAAQALPFLPAGAADQLAALDRDLSAAIRARDAAGYMALNYRFHFTLYRADPQSVLCPLIESLWLQLGPHMQRLVADAPAWLAEDRHQQAIAAIRAGDSAALRAAIAADIADAGIVANRAGFY